MIIYENIDDTLVMAHSDKGVMITDGSNMYSAAVDLIELHREYTETDVPVPVHRKPVDPDEATVEDYKQALTDMGVLKDEED